MTQQIYRYRFAEKVPVRDLEETLVLALMAVESLHGPAQLRMDGRYRFDEERRMCEIDTATQVGADLAKIFTGYATREFGNGAVAIETETTTGQGAGHCPCAGSGTGAAA